MFEIYAVQADNLSDFLRRYYRPDRFTHESLLKKYQEFLDHDGCVIIGTHDCVTGQVVAFFDMGACEVCENEPACWNMAVNNFERDTPPPVRYVHMCNECAWKAFEAGTHEADTADNHQPKPPI